MDHARARARFYLHTSAGSLKLPIEAYCLQNMQLITPAFPVDSSTVKRWQPLNLADPSFGQPRSIDLLLGADVYYALLQPEILRQDDIVAQGTVLGWILTGKVSRCSSSADSQTCTTLLSSSESITWHDKLISLLQRFWELEDIPKIHRKSPSEEECERIFTFHQRAPDGRYIVRLPFKHRGLEMLGESLTGALSCLKSLHRRLQQDTEMKKQYDQFMADYINLGHMRPLSKDELEAIERPTHYIAHHGIWQKGDHEKRLRVVFNASRPTSSGYSLNDVLHAGPKLQTNIAYVLIRWRRHQFAFCADICKMYRQILVDPQDVDLQRIVWSPDEAEPATHYQLLTVTYGETCSPYLSLRTLQQLCVDHQSTYPLASEVLRKDRFVDDLLTGSDTVEHAKTLRDQLTHLLQAGGFPLRKWVANQPELLEDLPETDRLRPTWHQLCSGGLVSELGVFWEPQSDCFRLTSPQIHSSGETKREILSVVAQLFDPCGWIAPTILIAKLIMQDLWRAGLDWDETIPLSYRKRWVDFTASLNALNNMDIPRWIGASSTRRFQLHAFSDASRRAMAAAVYSRVPVNSGSASVHLLVAKTKLCPIRSLRPSSTSTPRMTIPRLELRAALLAAKLLKSLALELEVPIESCSAWTDSQIVLHWLQSKEPTGNALVDNYVEHIQETLPISAWRHVPSAFNPADLATRGIECPQLLSERLWWNGPNWLCQFETHWPSPPPVMSSPSLDSTEIVLTCFVTSSFNAEYLGRFSNLDRLLRVTAYILRWRKIRLRAINPELVTKYINTNELKAAFLVCVQLSQALWLSEEMNRLQSRNPPSAKSPLKGLNTFQDSDGVLRIGGRLQNSHLPFSERHPPIVDARCSLSKLIIRWAHQRALHGGFRSTYAYSMHRAWIIGGKRQIRYMIHKCAICARIRARTLDQVMAPLPSARVMPSRPFSCTGLDYAGPFNILSAKGRGIRTSKGYIVVFVCFTTKMLHFELVGDMSTASLIGALTRFFSRRGKPSDMWSDNGTYFRRADTELQEAFSQAQLDWNQVSGTLATQEITWHFIPPRAPHFGGLWEAGVKLVKEHLKRTIGPRNLTYEEFNTLLASIELVLNSRPLVALTGDPEDLDALTPGHFAVGGPLISIPGKETMENDLDKLTHWQLIKAMRDRFWHRWSLEYLNTLQQRRKWTRSRADLKIGDLVVVVDPSLLSINGKWPLARILETHPGPDGHVRVATIKTANGEYKRPVTRLAPLPVEVSSSQDVSGVKSTPETASFMVGGP